MAVATYYYYEKVRRMMRTAIVSYLFKQCLDIHIGICLMPMGIARVTTGSVCRLLDWNQSSNYNILVLLRKTAITTTFYFQQKSRMFKNKIGACK